MTKEEVVAYFKRHINLYCVTGICREAEEMAIKALSAEPCDDCISRQAALDKAVYTETEEGWSGRTVDVKDIEALPPVTPKHKMGRWISIEDVMSVFDDFMCGEVDEDGTNTFLEMLKDKAESED